VEEEVVVQKRPDQVEVREQRHSGWISLDVCEGDEENAQYFEKHGREDAEEQGRREGHEVGQSTCNDKVAYVISEHAHEAGESEVEHLLAEVN